MQSVTAEHAKSDGWLKSETPKFRANLPVTSSQIAAGKQLLLHAPSGSWVIVGEEQVSSIVDLLHAAQIGVLDRYPEIAENKLIAQLYRSGLLSIDGQESWSTIEFDHKSEKINTLILKMVGYCNIACTYCYDFEDKSYKSRLTVEQGKLAIDGALENAGKKLNILFHGGEPLLAIDTIKELVAYARRVTANREFDLLFSVQTNGSRFTPEILSFLTDNQFSIGISLDGPAEFNDVHRVNFKGEGTFEMIVNALAQDPTLKERIGVLTTVTGANAGVLYEIACSFRDMGIQRWDVTLFQAAGRAATDPGRFTPETKQIIASYFELMDGIEQGEFDAIGIKPILHYLRNILHYERRNMCLRNGCGAGKDLVSVSADGTIEACDCISNPALSLGDIAGDGITNALTSGRADNIRSRTTASLNPCQTCDWRIFCGGTCLAKVGEVDMVDDSECEIALAVFPEILRRLALSDRLVKYAERFVD